MPDIDIDELAPAAQPAFCEAGFSSGGFDAAERVAGFLLLVVSGPVIAAAATVLALMSRRSPFVAHLRVGKNAKPLWVLKLRTMWEPTPFERPDRGWVERFIAERIVAETDGDPKDPADGRVASWFARFCRRHSIDEFPQLWHVVRGDMSLVGPRPLTRTEVRRHYGRYSDELLAVKPGLTGLWQTGGRSAIRFPERAAMDLALVRNMAPGLYAKILLRTLPALIQGKGAW